MAVGNRTESFSGSSTRLFSLDAFDWTARVVYVSENKTVDRCTDLLIHCWAYSRAF